MNGRPMKAWLRVADADVAEDDALARWVGIGTRYAASLPPKTRGRAGPAPLPRPRRPPRELRTVSASRGR